MAVIGGSWRARPNCLNLLPGKAPTGLTAGPLRIGDSHISRFWAFRPATLWS